MAGNLTEDIINDIEDLVSGLALLDENDIDAESVQCTDDVRQLLRRHLSKCQSDSETAHNGSVDPNTNAQINSETVKDLIRSQGDASQRLLTIATQLKKHISSPKYDKIRNDLYKAIPDTKERLQRAQASLAKDELTILVAGDTGSGKSSFLNLLLDERDTDILPVAHTSSTSAICEIRYGSEIRVDVKEVGSKGFRNIPIRNKEHALKVISEHAHQSGMRDETFKYEIVRIYWPVKWLQNGIMIVDSPGIAENPELTEMVKKYIPRASGFIYVINPTISGGFAPDRLRELLFAHLKHEKSGRETHAFDPKTAMFVCNKWDDISPNERDEIKEHIKSNLKHIWPGYGEDQLFFFSTKQAKESLGVKFVPYDYRKLLLGLERLLPIACQNRLTKQYWSLHEIIRRSNYTLSFYLMNYNTAVKEKGDKYLEIMYDLDRMERNQSTIMSDMNKMADREVEAYLTTLRDYLTNKSVMDHLLKWDENECPKITRKHDQLENHLEHAAHLRISNCIEQWERDNRMFERIAKNINDTFSSQFYELKAELDFIENCKLIPGKMKLKYIPSLVRFSSVYRHDEKRKGLKTYQKVLLGVTAPFWAPLSVVVGLAALPGLGAIVYFKNKEEKSKLKEYKTHKSAIMAEVTKTLLASLLDIRQLKQLFRDSIDELQDSIYDLISRLPNIIRANRFLAEESHKADNRRNRTHAQNYAEASRIGLDLENGINTIYLNQIKKYDIDKENLLITWVLIGEGAFSKVYEATYNGEPVAVKVPKNPASGFNSTSFVLEETNLRKLDIPNIVRFYGTALHKIDNAVFPLLVLECCQCSLDKIVLDRKRYKAPGTIYDSMERANGQAYRTAVRYCQDLSSALTAVHNLCFVHRDLKLQNILVDAEGIIKLADLGLSKSEDFISGSAVGTLLYMAPEVQRRKMYDHSADIFSLGMIIWELWYGLSVCFKYNGENLDEFSKNGFDDYAPPKSWMERIRHCIHRNPDERPAAHEMSRFFADNLTPFSTRV